MRKNTKSSLTLKVNEHRKQIPRSRKEFFHTLGIRLTPRVTIAGEVVRNSCGEFLKNIMKDMDKYNEALERGKSSLRDGRI